MNDLLILAQSNIFDPVGNEWVVGTNGWYYWAGFFTSCGFLLFAIVKRLASRVVGGGTEF